MCNLTKSGWRIHRYFDLGISRLMTFLSKYLCVIEPQGNLYNGRKKDLRMGSELPELRSHYSSRSLTQARLKANSVFPSPAHYACICETLKVQTPLPAPTHCFNPPSCTCNRARMLGKGASPTNLCSIIIETCIFTNAYWNNYNY